MKANFWLLFFAFLAAVLGHNVYVWLWNDFYYHGIAVYAVLNSTFNIRILDKHPHDEVWLRRTKKMSWLLFWASFSNLLDEAFFDPSKIQLNEYIAALVILVIILLKRKKDVVIKR